MNRAPDHESLLADVLAEGAPPDFRAVLLGETLRLARRRRQFRRARRAAAVIAAAGALGIFVWRTSPSSDRSPLSPQPPFVANYDLVRTHALPASAIVATQSFGAERLVVSFASIESVRTPTDDGIVQLIGDDELLALAAPRPAALIRVSPTEQELIFVDATNEDNSR